ncbi:TRAP transporter small permease [Pararhodobacter sp. SW119]|uniref:TRAP transporter small permease n=1 Tax=Pararhodobacter sp. SW119 TaxID=2780075 RepID=UPI001AE0CB4F|nr:TRAP transporter small permease [Pararhodobacter sp. SW119]
MRLIANFNRILMIVAAVAVTTMMLLVIADVLSSYLLGRQIRNSFEIVAFYLMVAVVFLPLGSVELSHEHITTDLMVQAMPRSIRLGLFVLTQLIGAAFVALLCYQTGIDALRSYARNEMVMGTTMLVTWPSRFFLPIGLAFLVICLLANAATAIWRGDAVPENSGGTQA